MNSTTDALIARLRRLSSTVVSDVLDRAGYAQQSLSSAIRPLAPTMRIAGSAVCFSGVSVYGESGVKALSPFEIDRGGAPDAVVVIAMNGHTVSSGIGGLMSIALKTNGCAGAIVDGGARDASEIIELGFPVFCRYSTPLNSSGRWALTTTNTPVQIAGLASQTVTVHPSDLIIGDADGVIVIPRAIVDDVIGWAERVVEIEDTIAARLRSGDTREAAFAGHPRFAHIRRLRD